MAKRRHFLFICIIVLSFVSCLGAKIKKQEGRTKNQVLRSLGYPIEIVPLDTLGEVYIYFYEDLSVNNYPSVVGILFIDPSGKVVRVIKDNTRLSYQQYFSMGLWQYK